MSYILKFDTDLNCIEVIFTGELSLSTLPDLAEQVAVYLNKYECRCILSDLRKATITTSTTSVYKMPEAAAEAGVGQGIKRALLVSDLGDFRFLETVFVNRGNTVKLFLDIDEARSCLLQ